MLLFTVVQQGGPGNAPPVVQQSYQQQQQSSQQHFSSTQQSGAPGQDVSLIEVQIAQGSRNCTCMKVQDHLRGHYIIFDRMLGVHGQVNVLHSVKRTPQNLILANGTATIVPKERGRGTILQSAARSDPSAWRVRKYGPTVSRATVRWGCNAAKRQ